MASSKTNKTSKSESSKTDKESSSLDQLRAAQNADDTQSSNGDDTGARHEETSSTSFPKKGDHVTEKEGVPGGGGLRTGIVLDTDEEAGTVSVAYLPAAETVKADTLDH